MLSLRYRKLYLLRIIPITIKVWVTNILQNVDISWIFKPRESHIE